jgi:hypothetical protein
MQRIVRIDFRQLLLDLAAAGMSPVDVAAELTRMLGERVAPSTPYRWLDGSTPLHPHGDALLILHTDEFATAKRRARSISRASRQHNPRRRER